MARSGRQRACGGVDRAAHLVQPVGVHAHVLEVGDDGGDDAVELRLADDEPATRAAAHLGDAVVLEDPHGLAEGGPAHGVAVEEVGLGPDSGADGPALGRDLVADAIRGPLRQLGCLPVGALHAHGPPGTRIPPRPAYGHLLEPARGVEVLGHEALGDERLAVDDRLDQLDVGLAGLAQLGRGKVGADQPPTDDSDEAAQEQRQGAVP